MTSSLVPPVGGFRATTGAAGELPVRSTTTERARGTDSFAVAAPQHIVSVLGTLPVSAWAAIVRLGDECRLVVHHASNTVLAGSAVAVLAVPDPAPIIRQIVAASAGQTRVLVYAEGADPEEVVECLKAGASGYVRHAEDEGAELFVALRQMCRQMGYVSTQLLGPVVDGLRRGEDHTDEEDRNVLGSIPRIGGAGVVGDFSPDLLRDLAMGAGDTSDPVIGVLAPWQRRMLVMVANELPDEAIARRLQLDVEDVRREVSQLCSLLGVEDRAGIVQTYAVYGLPDLGDGDSGGVTARAADGGAR